MAKYELNENQLKTIEALLARTDLKWSEVPAFNDLVWALSNPIQEEVSEWNETK